MTIEKYKELLDVVDVDDEFDWYVEEEKCTCVVCGRRIPARASTCSKKCAFLLGLKQLCEQILAKEEARVLPSASH